jgi:Na+-translocating ferredoxin:NAD+ oxidoreductase RnfD subunit
MPDDQKMLADLKKCMRACNGDTACMAACQTTFEGASGTTEEGKVFIAPDGNTAFVTKRGKVFNGGKVF